MTILRVARSILVTWFITANTSFLFTGLITDEKIAVSALATSATSIFSVSRSKVSMPSWKASGEVGSTFVRGA